MTIVWYRETSLTECAKTSFLFLSRSYDPLYNEDSHFRRELLDVRSLNPRQVTRPVSTHDFIKSTQKNRRVYFFGTCRDHSVQTLFTKCYSQNRTTLQCRESKRRGLHLLVRSEKDPSPTAPPSPSEVIRDPRGPFG